MSIKMMCYVMFVFFVFYLKLLLCSANIFFLSISMQRPAMFHYAQHTNPHL